MTYVVSDIHGQYNLFIKMLEEIKFSDSDEMWVLGDVVDRGEEPIKTLLYIINTPNIHMILGNHEEFMLDFFNGNKMPKHMTEVYEMSGYEMWFRNGGIDTIKDLMFNYSDKLDEILKYLKLLPLVYKFEVNHNIFYFAHANLSFSNGVPLKSQDRDFILWQRRRPTDSNIFEDNSYLITGHTITRNFGVDDIIFKSDNWYCIDCGAVFTEVLGCLRLDDFKEFYVSE